MVSDLTAHQEEDEEDLEAIELGDSILTNTEVTDKHSNPYDPRLGAAKTGCCMCCFVLSILAFMSFIVILVVVLIFYPSVDQH